MANEIEKASGIAIGSIEKVSGRTDDTVYLVCPQSYDAEHQTVECTVCTSRRAGAGDSGVHALFVGHGGLYWAHTFRWADAGGSGGHAHFVGYGGLY